MAAAAVPLALVGPAAADSHDTFHLRNANKGGGADVSFKYGRSDDIPIAGDWNGDGRTTIGIVRDGAFYLRNANKGGGADVSFRFGRPDDIPITGDWNGDGRTTIGIVRGKTFHLRNANKGGSADLTFKFGLESDLPITGDWDGDGRTTIGVVREGRFYLRNANEGGAADADFKYGRPDDVPVTGDWNGDGRTTIGIVRHESFHLRNANKGGRADLSFKYGLATDVPLTGDWAGDGRTTVGIVRHPGQPRHPAIEGPRLTCDGDAWEDDTELVGQVQPPVALDGPKPEGEAADAVRAVHLNALRYALGAHYEARYAPRQDDVYADVLRDHTTPEYAIRLPASTAVSVAIALRTGAYDAEAVGRSEGFASDYATWLTRSVACQHKSITTGGWGDHWQSAFWAYLTGKAGWLLWDELDEDDRFYVARMVEYEANRFIEYDVPYWRDASGEELYPGDSKAEENAWNADLLQLATAMMPEHPNWLLWQRRNVELMLSSFATPSDLDDDTPIHGQPLSEWLDGWNANADGTVVNHRRINPDYMSAIYHNWGASMTYGLAGMETPAAAFHNAELVYGALSTVEHPGSNCEPAEGPMYREGHHRVCFPEGYSWGPNRPAPYLTLDTMADVFEADGLAASPAADWASVRAAEQLALQSRSTDGRTYVAPDEDGYLGREEYAAQMLAFAWLAHYIADQAPPTLSDEDYAPPAFTPQRAEEEGVDPPDEEGAPTP